MKKRKIPATHKFWAIESSVWGLLPYTIREKKYNARRSVAVDEKAWKTFKKQGLYKLIRIRVTVSKI